MINKFHGDPELFSEGRIFLETDNRYSLPWRSCPFLPQAANLPAEDAVALEERLASHSGNFKISVLRLPRIANFDDLDPLRLEPGVTVSIRSTGRGHSRRCRSRHHPRLQIDHGRSCALRREGWDIDIAAHVRRGGHVLGLCGGYQMLGRLVHDPEGLEGQAGTVPGLGLLDVETTLVPDKTLTRIECVHTPTSNALTGYEIHLGRTDGPDCARPFAMIGDQPDGATSPTAGSRAPTSMAVLDPMASAAPSSRASAPPATLPTSAGRGKPRRTRGPSRTAISTSIAS